MRKVWPLIYLFIILVVAGCSPAGGEGGLEVKDAWGRNSPSVAENGAFYMIISNNGAEDDQLLGAEIDICNVVELHEMYMKENDVMGMRPVPGGSINIPAGESVELKVGGMHIMCIGKQGAFEVGDQFPIKLTFAKAGEMEVTAEIREGVMDMGG